MVEIDTTLTSLEQICDIAFEGKEPEACKRTEEPEAWAVLLADALCRLSLGPAPGYRRKASIAALLLLHELFCDSPVRSRIRESIASLARELHAEPEQDKLARELAEKLSPSYHCAPWPGSTNTPPVAEPELQFLPPQLDDAKWIEWVIDGLMLDVEVDRARQPEPAKRRTTKRNQADRLLEFLDTAPQPVTQKQLKHRLELSNPSRTLIEAEKRDPDRIESRQLGTVSYYFPTTRAAEFASFFESRSAGESADIGLQRIPTRSAAERYQP